MKCRFLLIGLLSLPLAFATTGCQKKENPKALHFGPSPSDGQEEGDEQVQEMHFGPNPGDGISNEDAAE